mmetsp:Transcript_16721/g.46721  ORF Transcript_16721/g.46721 Transcript_16721/m.46721 type:complete len:299 (+) Transcript_16721:6223-7119(+)
MLRLLILQPACAAAAALYRRHRRLRHRHPRALCHTPLPPPKDLAPQAGPRADDPREGDGGACSAHPQGSQCRDHVEAGPVRPHKAAPECSGPVWLPLQALRGAGVLVGVAGADPQARLRDCGQPAQGARAADHAGHLVHAALHHPGLPAEAVRSKLPQLHGPYRRLAGHLPRPLGPRHVWRLQHHPQLHSGVHHSDRDDLHPHGLPRLLCSLRLLHQDHPPVPRLPAEAQGQAHCKASQRNEGSQRSQPQGPRSHGHCRVPVFSRHQHQVAQCRCLRQWQCSKTGDQSGGRRCTAQPS